MVVRALVAGTNDLHTWHVDGHWFRVEPFSLTSPPTNTIHIGISERYDLSIARAGGPQNLPGDYLYYNGRLFKLREGSWGILRDLPPGAAGFGPPPAARPSAAGGKAWAISLSAGRAAQVFSVEAVEAPLPILGHPGKVFVLAEDRDAVVSGERVAEPLVLHVNVGDCIVIELTNRTSGGAVSMHADMALH